MILLKAWKVELEHEVKRFSYFNAWSSQRTMNFVKNESTPSKLQV